MPNLYAAPAGESVALVAAQLVLQQVPSAQLSQTILLLPTRRSAVSMRAAFHAQLGNAATLLPRMIPLADIGSEILTLIGIEALPAITSIAPAMPTAKRRFLLARQIMVFEERRLAKVSLHYALSLADQLADLQDRATRAGVTLTQENLRPLMHHDIADHWKQTLQFLSIISEAWPAIEQELGMTTQAAHEVAMLELLARHWADQPPSSPVFAIGSTASQPATAALLKVIADSDHGHVILPGLDTSMHEHEWHAIAPGHPLYHLKHFLDRWPLMPAEISALAPNRRSLWLDVLAPTAHIPDWANCAAPDMQHLSLIPCAHTEEEARVISLLIRETLETKGKRVALVTPDEGLMARVASHLKRDGILADRLRQGTLAQTAWGSLWLAIAAAIAEPTRQLHLRELLHHPALMLDGELLAAIEPSWHGIRRHHKNELPFNLNPWKMHKDYQKIENLLQHINSLSKLFTSVDKWVSSIESLLSLCEYPQREGAEAVSEAIAQLSYADSLGALSAEDFTLLLTDALASPWRDAGLDADTRIAMLTPVEARLEQFDRVILANMQEAIWPGAHPANPWLNQAAQLALGLPAPAEHISLMAHDVLMLGSGCEVFLTYPRRDGGSPTARSRFIERLLTFMAAQGIDEASIAAPHYIAWANAREASATYTPESEIFPRPHAAERPRSMQVTDIDKLFTDPFSIYAKYVLKLRSLKDIDATPEASDFGSLTHKAIEQLARHWDHEKRPANEAELTHIANHVLRDFSDQPNVELFWRTRLMNGLRFVNREEERRRTESLHVSPEKSIEGTIGGVTFQGRVDRIEQDGAHTHIIDHKTGEVPSKSKVEKGQALQLLLYAMLLDAPGATIEYWQLPRLGEEGEITPYESGALPIETITQALHAALTEMLDERTPFLATAGDARYKNEYAGISRWDEWAG